MSSIKPQEFKLPKNIRYSEECAFDLVFQEVSIRGQKKKTLTVLVTESNSEYNVSDTYTFKSWEDMQKQYPTLNDFLVTLSKNKHWESSWRDNDRIYYIASSIGHDGLYDIKETVWFDNQEPVNKKLKVKM